MVNLFGKIFLLIILTNFSLSQTRKTNLEVVEELINSVVDEISSYVNSKEIEVESKLENGFVENRFLNSLSQRYEVFFDDTSSNINVLRLDAFKSKISYKIESRGLFKKHRVKRDVKITFYCSMIENNKLLFSRNFEREYSDYVSMPEIKDIEDSSFIFTRGEFIDQPLTLSKIFEGLIAVFSIGIAIYLLFAMRK